jgi:hypothetical protein
VQYAIRSIRLAQAATAAFYFFGEAAFASVGRAPPRLLRSMDENKLLTAGAVFGLHTVATTLKSINAFEITYNGRLLHSKMKTGTFPDVSALVQQLANAKAEDQAQAQALRAAQG